MEGTRNERVAILIAAYVIGFITSYIAFGLTQLSDKFVYVPTVQTASVVSATQSASESVAIPAINKDGLVVVKDNEVRLLSALAAPSDDVLPEGSHVSIADYALSPDGQHVYFCEVPAADLGVCRPYIYDVAEDMLYPVLSDGQRVAFDTEGETVYWSSDGTLVFE